MDQDSSPNELKGPHVDWETKSWKYVTAKSSPLNTLVLVDIAAEEASRDLRYSTVRVDIPVE